MNITVSAIVPDASDSGRAESQNIYLPVAATLNVTCTVLDSSGNIVDLGANALVMTIKDILTNQPIIARQATISDPTTGVGVFPFVPGDTLGMTPAKLTYDIQLRYASGDMDVVLPQSSFILLPAVGIPTESVTVPASQAPLSVTPLATTLPLANGTAAVGVSTSAARADHVHPGSGGPVQLVFDAAEGGQTFGTAFGSGSFSVGVQIVPFTGSTLLGVHFWWSSPVATTVKCACWGSGGTLLDSVNVSVSGPGLYTGTFSAPVVMSVQNTYTISVHDTSSSAYPLFITGVVPSVPVMAGPGLLISSSSYTTGDAAPSTTVSAGSMYPVAPIYSIP